MKSTGQEAGKFSEAMPGLLHLAQPNLSQGSLGQQGSMLRAGGLTHSLSTLSIPSGPHSPSSSAPATPATPSTVTSASGHEVTSVCMLGRRESKESAAAARAEAKRLKAEQVRGFVGLCFFSSFNYIFPTFCDHCHDLVIINGRFCEVISCGLADVVSESVHRVVYTAKTRKGTAATAKASRETRCKGV